MQPAIVKWLAGVRQAKGLLGVAGVGTKYERWPSHEDLSDLAATPSPILLMFEPDNDRLDRCRVDHAIRLDYEYPTS
jgi:hypothetical protein